jgi:hypothetical protein
LVVGRWQNPWRQRSWLTANDRFLAKSGAPRGLTDSLPAGILNQMCERSTPVVLCCCMRTPGCG